MKWEYFMLMLEDTSWMGGAVDVADTAAKLNALGAQGWELVTAFDTAKGHGASRGYVYLFKRPILDGEMPPVQA